MFEREIEALVAAFSRAAGLLKRLVLSALDGNKAGNTPRGVEEVTGSLKNLSERWVRENAPRIYIAGMNDADGESPRDLDAELRASLNVQMADLTSRLLSASDAMRDDALGKLRHIALLKLRSTMLGEQTLGKAGAEFRDEIKAEGITLKDRLGRKITAESYSRMALRTTSALLLNNGTLDTAAKLGAPGVRVFDGKDFDDECREANGQAWGVGYATRHPIEHPQCTRSFSLLTTGYDGELDRT